MTPGFSFERFKQVSYRSLVINKKRYALGIGGTLIGLYAFWLLMGVFSSQQTLRENSTAILAFGTVIYQIGGYVLTASIFSELQSPGSASQFLTLPATTSEKLFSGWVISYVLYTIVAFLGLSLLLLVMTLTANLFFSAEVQSISELTKIYLNNVVLVYLVFNSVFLLGATYFKGNNFLKTAFSILLFFAVAGFLVIFITFLVGPDNITFIIRPPMFLQNSEYAQLLFQIIYTLPLTALFLVFSYYRLKNRQVA
jgi:hypothetical protein